MADWLNIAGGIGKGYVEGDQDNQRRAEFNYMQNQRQRQIKQQALDDALTEQLKNVRGAGTYTDYSAAEAPGGEGPDYAPPQAPTKTQTTVSEADAARARAAVYEKSGRPSDLAQAATFRNSAYQAQQQERAEQQAQDQAVLRQAGQLKAVGNDVGAMQLLAQHANQHPGLDGHQIVIEDRNGVPHAGLARNGQWVQQPTPINADSVQAMIDQGNATLTPELGMKAKELGIQGRVAGAHEVTAAAAKSNAESTAQKVYDETMGRGASRADATAAATNAYHYSLANWENIRSTIDKKAGKQTAAEKAQDLIDTYVPIIKAANPGMSDEQARMQAAQVALRDPNAKTSPDVGLSEQGLFRLKDQPGKLFRMDKKGEPEEVKLPVNKKALAGQVAGVLGAVDDGQGSATEPTSTFKFASTPQVTARGSGGPAPISERELDDWVPQLSKSFGIGSRKRVNRRTGETITEDEFNRRTQQ